MIRKVDEILKESFDTTRSLTTELSPQILTQFGLAAALHWLAKWYHQKHGLIVHVDAKGKVAFEDDQTRSVLFQSVRELLFNTVKHAKVKNARIEMNQIDNNHLQIIVSDQGEGFDPSKLKNRRSATGGFGLFNLRQRLELVDGHMEIESAPGCGSRFILTVPIKETLDQKTDTSSSQQLSAQLKLPLDEKSFLNKNKEIRILIVDDHPILREGLSKVLKAEPDLQVIGEASNGLEALKYTRSLQPDVILMDVNMPHLNGIDTTRQLSKKHNQCSIIGLSSFEDAEQGAAMRAAGAVAYLSKNTPTQELIQIIRDCIKIPN